MSHNSRRLSSTISLTPNARNELLSYLGVGMVLAYGVWLAGSLALMNVKVEAEKALAHVAAWLTLLIPGLLIPPLLLPNFGNTHRFLTFFLVTSVSGLFYWATREIQRTWPVANPEVDT